MRTIYDGYRMLETQETAFFAGANTGNGFTGEYGHIADESEKKRVWIIKGGSGTGKSTLMRKILADAAEAGYQCREYLCSSDPDSLDAVEISGQYVILDGTAPHVWEMQYPGAASEIIYMGKYWKSDILESEKEEIIRLTRQKTEAYHAGYTALAALSLLEREHNETALHLIYTEKLTGYLQRLLKSVPKTERTGGMNYCRTWGITMKGLCRTNGLAAQAEIHWNVEDTCQTAPCFFALLEKQCESMGIPAVFSRHPINDRITEAYIPALSLHIALNTNAPDKTICMNRFLQKEPLAEKKGAVRLAAKCMRSMLDDACGHFRKAGEIHESLEAIYKAAMDFPRMNRDTVKLRQQIRNFYIAE